MDNIPFSLFMDIILYRGVSLILWSVIGIHSILIGICFFAKDESGFVCLGGKPARHVRREGKGVLDFWFRVSSMVETILAQGTSCVCSYLDSCPYYTYCSFFFLTPETDGDVRMVVTQGLWGKIPFLFETVIRACTICRLCTNTKPEVYKLQ